MTTTPTELAEQAWATTPTVAGLVAARAEAQRGRARTLATLTSYDPNGLVARIADDLAGGAPYPDDLAQQVAADQQQRDHGRAALDTANSLYAALDHRLDTEKRAHADTALGHLRTLLDQLLDELPPVITAAAGITDDTHALHATPAERDAYLSLDSYMRRYVDLRKAQRIVCADVVTAEDWRALQHVSEIRDTDDLIGAWRELRDDHKEARRPWPEIGTRAYITWAAGPGRALVWLPGIADLRDAHQQKMTARTRRGHNGRITDMSPRVGDGPHSHYVRTDPDAYTSNLIDIANI
ncbi:hypothetical protein OG216_23570 [Streptomycetaceae bacterium NBC_01309]